MLIVTWQGEAIGHWFVGPNQAYDACEVWLCAQATACATPVVTHAMLTLFELPPQLKRALRLGYELFWLVGLHNGWNMENSELQEAHEVLGPFQCTPLLKTKRATLSISALHLSQTKQKGDDAKSTTAEEIQDNLWLICQAFKKETGYLPVLVFDNAAIQAVVDTNNLSYGDTPLVKISPIKSRLPTYSSDMNRPIEHVFGVVKPRVHNIIYKAARDYSDAAKLQTAVVEAFASLKPGSVASDIEGLPLLWKIISTPAGQTFVDDEGHTHTGTGGDYPPKRYR